MKSKQWVSLTFVIFLFSFSSIYCLIYFTDPYGYFSHEKKYIHNLTRIDSPNIVHNKIRMHNDIYLIGSSRQMRINPLLVSQYTEASAQNIAIRASTFEENMLLATTVKGENKQFIFGFDAFFLNQSRTTKNQELRERLEKYKNALKETNNIYLQLFNIDMFTISLEHLRFVIKQRPYDYQEVKENNYIADINEGDLLNGFYDSYNAYSDDKIIKLAKLADKKDTFIIFPKHAFYYKMFQEDEDIEKKYFHMLKLLVKNTDASVWSFYDINQVTTEKSSFDDKGWHFKPKIGDEILKLIYTGHTNTQLKTFKLTKNNIDTYLQETSLKVKQWQPK